MMYRVLAVIGSALALAACSSSSDWMNLDALKPGPSLDTVSLESEPPGAEAKASNGQTCRTPCALALPVDAASSVTFTLNGYQPETERLEAITATGEPPRLRPNPVVVELTPGGPSVAKKPAPKKPAAKKPAARPKPAAAAAPAPMTAATGAGALALADQFGPTSKLDSPTSSVRAADHARVGAMVNIDRNSYMK